MPTSRGTYLGTDLPGFPHGADSSIRKLLVLPSMCFGDDDYGGRGMVLQDGLTHNLPSDLDASEKAYYGTSRISNSTLETILFLPTVPGWANTGIYLSIWHRNNDVSQVVDLEVYTRAHEGDSSKFNVLLQGQDTGAYRAFDTAYVPTEDSYLCCHLNMSSQNWCILGGYTTISKI